MALRGWRMGDLVLADDGCSAGPVSVVAEAGSLSMESSAYAAEGDDAAEEA